MNETVLPRSRRYSLLPVLLQVFGWAGPVMQQKAMILQITREPLSVSLISTHALTYKNKS